MNWTEVQTLLPTTLPLPDVGAHPAYQGADGVELWLLALVPHLVRCEVVLNGQRLAADPSATLTAHFAVSAKADEYSAADGGRPVEIQAACYYPIDFSCGGLTALPPPPPVVSGVVPLTGEIGTQFVVTGLNFAGATGVELVGGPTGAIVSATATQIVVTFADAGTGLLRVTTPSGNGTGTQIVTVEGAPPS